MKPSTCLDLNSHHQTAFTCIIFTFTHRWILTWRFCQFFTYTLLSFCSMSISAHVWSYSSTTVSSSTSFYAPLLTTVHKPYLLGITFLTIQACCNVWVIYLQWIISVLFMVWWVIFYSVLLIFVLFLLRILLMMGVWVISLVTMTRCEAHAYLIVGGGVFMFYWNYCYFLPWDIFTSPHYVTLIIKTFPSCTFISAPLSPQPTIYTHTFLL